MRMGAPVAQILGRCSGRCFGVLVLVSTVFPLQCTKPCQVVTRDRAVTETTIVLHTFRSHLVGCVVSVTFSSVVSVTHKTVTSPRPLKMADSMPLDTAVESVPIPIARQKTGAKGDHKAAVLGDVKSSSLHIISDLDERRVLRKEKQSTCSRQETGYNEYLFPTQIALPTLSKMDS